MYNNLLTEIGKAIESNMVLFIISIFSLLLLYREYKKGIKFGILNNILLMMSIIGLFLSILEFILYFFRGYLL